MARPPRRRRPTAGAAAWGPLLLLLLVALAPLLAPAPGGGVCDAFAFHPHPHHPHHHHRPRRPPPAAATAATASSEAAAAAGEEAEGGRGAGGGEEEPFGLTWFAADRYRQQPDFPVLFLATRNESYAREVERHFSEQGYFVRSTRTVTRLAKMVRTTRPEGILLSDHLSAPHLLSFLESLRDLPDLWLVPVLLVHDPTTDKDTGKDDSGGGDGGDAKDHRRRQWRQEEEAAAASAAASPTERLHREALRLGARCVVDPGTPGATVQAMVEGGRRTRRDVEGLVHNLQGAVLHWAQHRRRLLPSTVVLGDGERPALSSTEQEVLNLVCRGMTDAQIAHSLGLTKAAVGHAARAVMEKLGCDLRGEVIRVALDNDLVTE